MVRRLVSGIRGFTLIEAMLVMIVIGTAFFGFGFLFGNMDQQALKADLTVLAAKLAKQKVEEVLQQKADSGYAAVSSQSPQTVASGAWQFTRAVNVSFVNPTTFANSVSDTGYKKVEVVVSWGAGAGESVSLTTLVTNMVPDDVSGGGGGFPSCP